jgi:EAL domain-containing protein (putative c-di-GMP-specific phosphodiesterase class I)
MDKNHRIFVNSQANSIADPEFKGGYLRKFLQDLNITPENIVFEINEREAITNWEIFEKSLAYYLNLGFSVALDDAGAGYSSFETILKIKPNYIKIDMGIIRDVQTDIVKQQIVKSLVAINNSINAVIIAEGVQSIEECRTLKELGVTHGQGFLFAKPGVAFPLVDSEKLLATIKEKD